MVVPLVSAICVCGFQNCVSIVMSKQLRCAAGGMFSFQAQLRQFMTHLLFCNSLVSICTTRPRPLSGGRMPYVKMMETMMMMMKLNLPMS